MGYESATSTKLFATHCIICNKPLCDPESIERGMGPECSAQGYLDDGEDKNKAKQIVHNAALAATAGYIEDIKRYADELEEIGYTVAAQKIRENFTRAERAIEIEIIEKEEDGELWIKTPFRRAVHEEFIEAWRSIPGRYFRNKHNIVPTKQKLAVWILLKQFFPGKYGKGPKGIFRIPKSNTPDINWQ